jgi:hypothetical protein
MGVAVKEPTEPGEWARRRAAKAAGKLTAAEFGARLNASPPLIRKLRRSGKIAADQDGMIDPGEEDRIRARYPCHEPSCPRVGLGPSGYCENHKANGQRGAKRTPEQKARISEGMRGKPRPANAEAMRKRWANPEQRKTLRKALDKGRAKARARAKAERDARDVTEIVKRLRARGIRRSYGSVTEHIRQDVLEAEKIALPGRGLYVAQDTAIEAYIDWLESYPDGRLRRFDGYPWWRGWWYSKRWPGPKETAEFGRLTRRLSSPEHPPGPKRKVEPEQIAEIWRRRTTGPMVKRSIREIAGDMGPPEGSGRARNHGDQQRGNCCPVTPRGCPVTPFRSARSGATLPVWQPLPMCESLVTTAPRARSASLG